MLNPKASGVQQVLVDCIIHNHVQPLAGRAVVYTFEVLQIVHLLFSMPVVCRPHPLF